MTKMTYKALYQRAQFLNHLGRDLERISSQQDPSRVIRFCVRRLGELLQADVVLQVGVNRPDGSLELPYALALTPRGQKILGAPGWRAAAATGTVAGPAFLETCRQFLLRPLNPSEADLLLLRVTFEDRPVAILGFRRPGKRFTRAETKLGQDAAQILAGNLRHRERERAQGLKERIYAKILSEMRPQDVLYQILHGLKRLLQYDHGAAVLLLNPEGSELTIQAEIVAHTKAKSERIGRRLPVTPGLRQWMDELPQPVLLRGGEVEQGAPDVPEALRGPLREEPPGTPPALGMIVAALRHATRTLGILQIRSRSAAAFTQSDLKTLKEFLPLASVTLFNSTLYKTQHDLLVSAERKTALADLARAISHDLNNAFGVMLPLLQAMRRDVTNGAVQPQQLANDLEVLERYSRSSGRIFQGLLSVAHGGVEPARWGDLNAILEAILRMLGQNLEAKRIRVVREFDPALPRVYLRRADMEQLFLNLTYNSRDAMPEGGTLTLRTAVDGPGVRVEVLDTGQGITEEIRSRVFEPFFTTKETGSGLGLDICRSIVWDYDGRLDLDSTPGQGTRVSVWLPFLAERLREEAAEAVPDAARPLPSEKDTHES